MSRTRIRRGCVQLAVLSSGGLVPWIIFRQLTSRTPSLSAESLSSQSQPIRFGFDSPASRPLSCCIEACGCRTLPHSTLFLAVNLLPSFPPARLSVFAPCTPTLPFSDLRVALALSTTATQVSLHLVDRPTLPTNQGNSPYLPALPASAITLYSLHRYLFSPFRPLIDFYLEIPSLRITTIAISHFNARSLYLRLLTTYHSEYSTALPSRKLLCLIDLGLGLLCFYPSRGIRHSRWYNIRRSMTAAS